MSPGARKNVVVSGADGLFGRSAGGGGQDPTDLDFAIRQASKFCASFWGAGGGGEGKRGYGVEGEEGRGRRRKVG